MKDTTDDCSAPRVSKGRTLLCHVTAAFFGLCVVAPFALMMTDNRTCQITRNGKITPNEGAPGTRLTVEWDALSLVPCEGNITIRVIDSAGTVYETESVRAVYKEGDGKWRHYSKVLVVPSAVPGDAQYDPIATRWRWRVQWLWPTRERPHREPVMFTILSPLAALRDGRQQAQRTRAPHRGVVSATD